jgi:FkbM family methyltransferase
MINKAFIRQVGSSKWVYRYARRQFDKRILRRDSRLRLPTGLTINLPRWSSSATEVFLTNADIDWGAEALFSKFGDPKRDFLDIGAHIGYYSLYLSPLIRTAIAFEPDPRNIPGLELNAKLAHNVDVMRMAVSSSWGVGRLHVGRSSAASTLEIRDDESIEVALTTVDDFTSSHPGIDVALMKTDIEGHDLDALQGAAKTVMRWQPLILTECNRSELWGLCRDWGYAIFAFTRDRTTFKKDFRRMAAEDLSNRWYKMLFLVPHRLEKALEDFGPRVSATRTE